MDGSVQIEQHGAVLVIAINRPQQRNAVTHAVSLAIANALDRLDADLDLRVGIITGRGSSFCAGMRVRAIFRIGDVEVPAPAHHCFS